MGIVRMAVLTEGQKLCLSSKSQTNKSVLYVKLTDSALRSLEEYLKNKAVLDGRQGPSLQFTENGGAISLPALDRGSVSYSFSLSSAEDGGQAGQNRYPYVKPQFPLFSRNHVGDPARQSLG